MILETLAIDPAELERRTGWQIKPQGACKGDRCVPLPAAASATDRIDARLLSERLADRRPGDRRRELLPPARDVGARGQDGP